jgi:hypothetical protein
MTGAGRAWLGAIIGAALVTVSYPQARAFLLTGLTFRLPTVSLLPVEGDRLRLPTDEVEAAGWLLSGAEQIIAKRELKESEFMSLKSMARGYSATDPSNAFWNQMLAVLSSGTEAQSYWTNYGRYSTYNDYQSDAVARSRLDYMRSSGAAMAWHSAALYTERRSAAATLVKRSAAQMLEANPSLELRLATLENGRLLRDGARSLATAEVGVTLVEGASYPPTLKREPVAVRRLLLARTDLAEQVRKDQPQSVARLEETFRANDAWLAMTSSDEPKTIFRSLALGSLATGVLPGALALVAACGLVLWGIVMINHRYQPLAGKWRPVIATVLSVTLGWGAWAATHLWLPAISAAACALVLLYQPRILRSKIPDSLGPLFEILVALLAIGFLGLMAMFLGGMTAPAVLILSRLDFPAWSYGGAAAIAGLAVLNLGFVCLLAPLFALAQRIPTAVVFDRALRQFAGNVTVLAATAAMVGLPVSILIDQRLRKELTQIAENEPLYHYNRWFRVR